MSLITELLHCFERTLKAMPFLDSLFPCMTLYIEIHTWTTDDCLFVKQEQNMFLFLFDKQEKENPRKKMAYIML